MKAKNYRAVLAIWLLFASTLPGVALGQASGAQASGVLRGTVTLRDNGTALHNAIVTIVQLKRSVETDERGNYEFAQVPPGNYSVLAHLEGFPDAVEQAQVTAGGTASLDIQLRLSGVKEQITVTATGSEQSTFQALQTVTSLDSTRLAEEGHPSLGEVLDKEPGVAKRSFGPGSARPVIRGF
ncbi:MAG TPA: carboxypeptidase-like regulatory domain-containing protein, partial [Blastocatellia bacterium]|nr:carboxypeptidase-like regulatory domain-containing protein [Blastocatellia bacterium]